MNFEFNKQAMGIYAPENLKLKRDERLLVKTSEGDWFLVKRLGQRSWGAICVAEALEADYENIDTANVGGNASSIMKELEDTHGIAECYSVTSKKQYRMAMVSILSTGRIDTPISVSIID